MKVILKLLFILVCTTNSFGQFYPVFKEMAVQPPSKGSDYRLSLDYVTCNSFLYAMQSKILANPKESSVVYHIWDGSSWTELKETKFTDGSVALVKWGQRIIGYGRVTGIDSLFAPSGKYFAFIEYKNGRWDTLPGGTFEYNKGYLSYAAASKDGIFYSVDSVGDPYHSHGFIYKYNENTLKFERFLAYRAQNGQSGGIKMIGGEDRVIFPGVLEINNKWTWGFGYIENDSLFLNNNQDGYGYMYAMDHTNGHIYSLFPPGRFNKPSIGEYGDSFIEARRTSLNRNTSPGAESMDGNSFKAYDGKVIYENFESQTYPSYTKHISVLYKGDSLWKNILNSNENNEGENLGTMISAKTGMYTMAISGNKKILELKNGSMIDGMAYMDADTNCIKDTSKDVALKMKMIQCNSTKHKYYAVTDNDGHYELYVLPDTFVIKGPGVMSACSDSTLVLGYDSACIKHIPTKIPQFYDIKVKLLGGFKVRWNSRNFYTAMIENAGPPVDSAYYEFKMDPKLTVDSGAMGQVRNLGYFEKRRVYVYATTDPVKTKPDSFVCNGFSAYLYRNDINLANNRDSFCQKVVYSLDPNHKDCNKEKIPVSQSTKLEYFIGFQNEGSDTAFDVVVTDTLSPSLIIDSVKVLEASHEYSMWRSGNILNFTFSGVNLVPKVQSDEKSSGFVKFSIYNRSGLKEGDSITNKAYIFFDLNAPVITNTAVVKISDKSTELISLKTGGWFNAYPNPFKDEFNIYLPGNRNAILNIYNSTGQLILSKIMFSENANIDLKNEPAGMYIVEVISEGTVSHRKLIKR